MEKTVKCIKNNIGIFCILSVFTFILLIEFFPMHYAGDTYVITNVGYEEYALKWFLAGGRVFSCLTLLLADFLNISINTYVIFSLIVAIFVSCITVILLKNIVLSYKPVKKKYQEILILIVSYFTIFNFTYLEIMYFAECSVMAMSVLLYTLAAKILVEKPKMYFLKSLILFILAVFSYQGTNGIFFAMVILFSVIKYKSKYTKIITNLIKSGLIVAGGIALNAMQVRVVANLLDSVQKRTIYITKIKENIMFIFERIIPKIYLDGCGLFPRTILVIFILLVILIAHIYFTKKEKSTHTVIQFGIFVLIAGFSSMVTFVMTKSSFDSGRMHFSVGAFLGMLFIYLYCNTDIFSSNFKYILTSIFISYSCITVFMYMYIIHEHKILSNLDYIEAKKIDRYISDYEKETGINVKNTLVILGGKERNKVLCTLTNSSIQSEHSVTGLINYYTGRNLKEKKALLRNGDSLKENFKCEGDTLFINAYIY